MPFKRFDPVRGLFSITGSVIVDAPDYDVGDTVVRVTTESSRDSAVKRGAQAIVTGFKLSSAIAEYMEVEEIDGTPVKIQYINVRHLLVTVNQSTRDYKTNNFAKVRKPAMLGIESTRPTLVREFRETTVDGKVVREYIGDIIEFDSLSAARVYTTQEITTSIRKDNVYRKFSIMTENSVAQAKEPEIEFK